MSAFPLRAALPAAAILLSVGCNKSSEPAWALNSATVYVDEDGLEGTHLWEFFAQKWEKKQKEKFYRCAVVQEVVGDVTATMDGCEGCKAVYTIELVGEDADCDDGISEDPALSGIRAFAIGDVPDEIAEFDPHPGDSFGWYLSFDGFSALPHGFAYNEVLDQGGAPDYPGWAPDYYYVLEPAYAWSL